MGEILWGGPGEGGQDIEELPETLPEAEPESAEPPEPPEVGGVGGGVTEDGEADDDAGNADIDDPYLPSWSKYFNSSKSLEKTNCVAFLSFFSFSLVSLENSDKIHSPSS